MHPIVATSAEFHHNLAPAAHHARIFSSYDDAGYRDNDIGSRSSVDSMPCVEDPERHPIRWKDDIGLSDQDLVLQSTKSLNKLIKKKGLSKDRAKQIKQERRTLKNRGYAANCRVKREEEEKNLEKENANLRDQINVRKRQIHDDIRIIEQLEKKIKMAEDEIEEMKRSFNIQFGEILDERDLGFEEMDDEDFKQEYEDPHLRKISANGIKIEKVYD